MSARAAEFLEANAAELVGIVFATLPIYRDAQSRQAVLGFLREAIAASDVFLKAFAAALIKCDPAKRSQQVISCWNIHKWRFNCKKSFNVFYASVFYNMMRACMHGGWPTAQQLATLPASMPQLSREATRCAQECVVLLSWNSLLLRQLRLPAAAKAAARVVASQAGLLDALLVRPEWQRIAALPGGVLREKPALLDDYVAVARATGGATGSVHSGHSAVPSQPASWECANDRWLHKIV